MHFQTCTPFYACAASFKLIYFLAASALPKALSLQPPSHILKNRRIILSLSLTLQTTLSLFEQPSLCLLTNLYPIASTGKRSSTAGAFAHRSKKGHRSLLPTIFSGETTTNRAPQLGMGFKSLPSLAIASVPFRFLKSLDLSSLCLGLDVVPSCFGWELVE